MFRSAAFCVPRKPSCDVRKSAVHGHRDRYKLTIRFFARWLLAEEHVGNARLSSDIVDMGHGEPARLVRAHDEMLAVYRIVDVKLFVAH